MISYFDFGAHRGIKAAEYAKLVEMSEAFLYEPNPAIKTAKIPGVPTEIHQAAAWDSYGRELLYVGQTDDATGSSLLKEKTTGDLDKKHPIIVATFNAAQMLLSASMWAKDPIEIKMNIEGAEYRVFRRMRELKVLENVQIKAIHLSLHSHKLDMSNDDAWDADLKIVNYLVENGFKLEGRTDTQPSSPFGQGFTTWRR